ncbi:hypothetical protein EBT25_01400 [bacterium]|nr:hypothetical protein [bacterium]
MAHEISDFIDAIKESLTDAQYKEGMELCQKVFQRTEDPPEKLYRMTYLRPYTFVDDHCEDEDCVDTKFLLSFTKATSLVRLTDQRAARIREENMFLGSPEAMSAFIDIEVLRGFPNDLEELASEMQWYEFPVLSLENVSCETQTTRTA